MSASKLIRPDAAYKDSYIEALSEYHKEGRYKYNKLISLRSDFDSFVKSLNAERGRPHQPYEDWVGIVPETIAWLVKDEEYLGTVYIRHRLNWHLEKWGGHIHFIIRPSKRGLGYGRKLLLKTLPIAHYLGIERALLTVDPENENAKHVIERCGATFKDETTDTERFPARLRYWINCR